MSDLFDSRSRFYDAVNAISEKNVRPSQGVTQMKEELKQIYFDLSVGKLSQKEALDRIEALKLHPRDEKPRLLSATPLWRNKINETCTELFDCNSTEHHIVFCDSSKPRDAELKLFFPRARIASLNADENKNIGQRYTEYALACFERIQALRE